MTQNPPRVYIFHGDDEFSIAQAVDSLKSKLESSGVASLDISQLDGHSDALPELEAAAFALPFLAERRVVVFQHPLANLSGEPLQEKFIKLYFIIIRVIT